MQLTSRTVVCPGGAVMFDVMFSMDDGSSVRRILDVDTYVALIRECRVEEKEKFFEVPLGLPEEMIRCQAGKRADTYMADLVLPEKKRPLIYMSGLYYVPFPKLLARISINRGNRKDTRLFAVMDDEIVKDTVLYHYPFGNVGIDGRCCYGNISAHSEGPRDSMKVLNLFIQGNTNDDLYHYQNAEKLTQMQLIERLEGMDCFPKELLVESRFKYGDLK